MTDTPETDAAWAYAWDEGGCNEGHLLDIMQKLERKSNEAIRVLRVLKGDIDHLGHWLPDQCRQMVEEFLANDKSVLPADEKFQRSAKMTDKNTPPKSPKKRVVQTRLVQRRAKLLAATIAAKMIEHWWVDGCPTGNDSDEYDIKTYEDEAKRIMRQLDARVTALLPPLNAHVARSRGRTPLHQKSMKQPENSNTKRAAVDHKRLVRISPKMLAAREMLNGSPRTAREIGSTDATLRALAKRGLAQEHIPRYEPGKPIQPRRKFSLPNVKAMASADNQTPTKETTL